MSSAISISGAPSVISDVDHSNILGENENAIDKSSHLDSQERLDARSAPQGSPIIPEYQGKPLFEPGDGDYMLWVNDTCFETHKYLLKRFRTLKCLSRDQPVMKLRRDEGGAEDFRHTLTVLYATILEGPFEFEKSTLVSALRIATAYDYPALSLYAINHLEKAQLTAIERIKIAREFGLVSWEEPAYFELCERDEPITMEEASVLGMDMFVRVAGIREREQRRRGKEVDTQNQEQETKPKASEENGGEHDGNHEAGRGRDNNDNGEVNSSSQEDDSSAQTSEVEMNPSFLEVQLGAGYTPDQWIAARVDCHLPVPNCPCSFEKPDGSFKTPICTLPACAVAAFKNLQVQQITHANSIARLQSTVDELNASMIEPAPRHAPAYSGGPHSLIHEEVRLMLSVARGSPHGA